MWCYHHHVSQLKWGGANITISLGDCETTATTTTSFHLWNVVVVVSQSPKETVILAPPQCGDVAVVVSLQEQVRGSVYELNLNRKGNSPKHSSLPKNGWRDFVQILDGSSQSPDLNQTEIWRWNAEWNSCKKASLIQNARSKILPAFCTFIDVNWQDRLTFGGNI